ncbi:MAG: carboxypeptidase-like regulatory domain-containing protein [Bacteroidetes bacterium]|nr:carboxypeptidase-like regulatory domain-containing protein [Bacteroidota bacterium]
MQDKATGERLIGANIIFTEIGNGTNTNAFGYFSYAVPRGKYRMAFSFIGYFLLDTVIDISNTVNILIELNRSVTNLQEVKLTGKLNDKVNSMQLGYDELPLKLMGIYPALLGEKDALQFLKTYARYQK